MTVTATNKAGAASRLARHMGGWLACAAAPTFFVMAWVAAHDATGMAMCPVGPHILPIDGMTVMYLLMGLFHLRPWLALASGAGHASNR